MRRLALGAAMNLLLNIGSALASLRGSVLRSALTILGIVIGVGSVVLLIAIGQGVKDDVTRQIEGLGTNLLMILPGRLDPSGQPNPMAMMGISTLTDADLAAIRALPGVRDCVPIVFVAGGAETATTSSSGMVLGATAAIGRVRKARLAAGRFFTDAEADRRTCVLSSAPAASLFPGTSAVGGRVAVRGIPFTVVGVLGDAEEQASLSGPGGGMRNVLYIPYAAARSDFHGQINRIIVATDYRNDPDATIASLRTKMLALRAGREDFGIVTQRQLLAAIYRVFNIVTALLAGIAAISLVVAAIGITNIMLVTVTERTREIGIRKAVGARRRDIFTQFLTEAVVMSFIGGLVGIALATAVCAAIARSTPLRPVITAGAVGVAFGVCFVVGVVAGVAPAVRGARCSPIDALRYE